MFWASFCSAYKSRRRSHVMSTGDIILFIRIIRLLHERSYVGNWSDLSRVEPRQGNYIPGYKKSKDFKKDDCNRIAWSYLWSWPATPRQTFNIITDNYLIILTPWWNKDLMKRRPCETNSFNAIIFVRTCTSPYPREHQPTAHLGQWSRLHEKAQKCWQFQAAVRTI